MSSYLESLVDHVVSVISNEGRVYTGILKSFDQSMNLVMNNCYEKVYSQEEGVEFLKLGLYFLRGDNVAIVSEIDENLEKQVDYKEIRAEPIKELKLHN